MNENDKPSYDSCLLGWSDVALFGNNQNGHNVADQVCFYASNSRKFGNFCRARTQCAQSFLCLLIIFCLQENFLRPCTPKVGNFKGNIIELESYNNLAQLGKCLINFFKSIHPTG